MNTYIQEMRRHIGRKPLLLCGASVLVFNGRDEVLMLRRSDNGQWCFPGGAVEPGETTEETAARELAEETGLAAEGLELFQVFSGKDLHYIYPNGDEVYIVDVVYLCRSYKGEVRVDTESREYRFFPAAELPGDISPPVWPVVEAVGRTFAKNE